jgi:hypothetical protein
MDVASVPKRVGHAPPLTRFRTSAPREYNDPS